MKLRWFLSPVLRQATDAAKHVRKLMHAQSDIMNPQAAEAINNILVELDKSIADDSPDLVLLAQMKMLDDVVGRMIKPYPNAHWRENIEVMLVAIVVAMGIRTFFVQPFKIPTGSMQPTLYGNEPRDMRRDPPNSMPGFFGRVFEAVAHGKFFHEFVPEADGQILEVKPVEGKFIHSQRVSIQYRNVKGLTTERFWFVPEDSRILQGAGLYEGLNFKKGEVLMRFSETSGDHLFVDRVTYNFRHPNRGEIVVFKTKGTEIDDQNQFYIKRLVGLPNERISIGDDRHIRINGTRLDAATPHFENVYSFNPNAEPQASVYSGHTFYSRFANAQYEHQISDKHYMVFGDNTMNSSDSRHWGEVPQENFIGKSWLVYWPISERFGWGQK